eukprot:scaffold19081_cov118-Skeletonema_menzelii.AAC.1
MYSDRSGYLGTVYDESRYSRESRGSSSRHDSYRSSGRSSSRDRYDDDGYVDDDDDDYTKDVDSYGEPYDHHDQDSRRGDDDGYNDSYYSQRSYNDSASISYDERKPIRRGSSNGYDDVSYNDDSYAERVYGEEGDDYNDGRRRDDDDYYDGPPLT